MTNNLLETRLGLASAQVGDGPGGVADHAEFGVVFEDGQHRRDAACCDDGVAEQGGVAGDVAQRPDGLLAHVGVGGGKQSDELGDGSMVDDVLRVLGGAGGDVGQGPGGLELKGLVGAAQHLDETGH